MEYSDQLAPAALYRRCDPSRFPFNTTAELEPLSHLALQPRAEEALRFGLSIGRPGFNLFIMGEPGCGRHDAALESIRGQAAAQPASTDLCAVYNFLDPYAPGWVQLPAGSGAGFVAAVAELVESVGTLLPAAFAADEYANRVQEIEERQIEHQEQALHELEQTARESGIQLLHTPAGFAFAPVREEQVLQGEAFERLPAAERAIIEESLERYQQRLKEVLDRTSSWRREAHQEVRQLDRQVADHALHGLFEELAEVYAEYPGAAWFLEEIREDLLQQLPRLRRELEQSRDLFAWQDDPHSLAARYRVNALVLRQPDEGAPWQYLAQPSMESLFGWSEYRVEQGALVGGASLLRAGAIQRNSGGYLLLDAEKLLMDSSLWPALKQVLATGYLRWDRFAELSDRAIKVNPEPLAVNLTVVLIGSRTLYYQLVEQDPEFLSLFKVQVDFEERILRDDDTEQQFARLLAGISQQEGLLPITVDGVTRLIEEAARLVGDADRLSTHVARLADIIREADYWARQEGKTSIFLVDVARALHQQERRMSRVRERFQEDILRNNVVIVTEGQRFAQVNGLSVIDAGDYSFGLPSRITATAWLGEGEIIDIEREVELGGALHSKGVLILSQFLGARYARTRPLSVTASLVFEQNYGPLDGDSASLGELCALLSALAEIPMAQHLAVTGSVNQLGEVQAIGGVNEKVEGFFDICKARGLTGDQGVILPRANVVNLMLRQDVIRAVSDKQFHLFAVDHVDEAMALLAGMPAGKADDRGDFPKDSVNGRVTARLIQLADLRKDDDDKKTPSGDEKQDG